MAAPVTVVPAAAPAAPAIGEPELESLFAGSLLLVQPEVIALRIRAARTSRLRLELMVSLWLVTMRRNDRLSRPFASFIDQITRLGKNDMTPNRVSVA
jgi:hypothetical protein